MDDAARVPAPSVPAPPVPAPPDAAPLAPPLPAHPPRDDAARAAQQLTADATRTATARRLQSATARPDLDGLAAVAARLFGAASGRISLLADGPTVVGVSGPQPRAAGRTPAEALALTVCSQTAAAARPLVIPDTHLDLRVAQLPSVRDGDVGSYLGAPLATLDGRVVGALCVFDPVARDWEAGDASLLQHVADAATARLELAAVGGASPVSSVLEAAVASAGVGTFDLQVATGRVVWDEQTLALFGLTREEFTDEVDFAIDRIHPEDRDTVRADLAVAVATGGYTSSYRVVLPDGTTRWMEARGRVLREGADGEERLVGTVLDVTAQHRVVERIAGALEGMAVGYVAVDRDGRVVHVNAAAEALSGTSRVDLVGRTVVDLFAGDAAATEVVGDLVRRAQSAGEAFADVTRPGPAERWVELRAVAEGDGLAVYLLDTTARRTAARAVERLGTRAALLAEVAAVFTGPDATDDPDVAAQRLAELLVPALGDWSVVTLVDDGDVGDVGAEHAVNTPVRSVPHPADLRRGLRDVGRWHRDPERVPLVVRYAEHRLPDLTQHAFLWRALREDRPLRVADATAAVSAVLTPEGTARRVLAELAPSSALVLPLRGRGRTVGLLTLFQGPDRAPLDEEDVETVVELAARAGLALESARLHRRQRRFAEALQRSLLTDPPAPAHAEVVVRYVPSARTAQVGGDWYDAVEQSSGTVLVIGDVVGHDTRAATVMAQVRTVVRTLTAVGDDPPADVLARADRVVASSQPDVTASVLAVRLEDVPGGGTGTRLRWSSAGHPPALVLTPAGAVEALEASEADLLLGVDPAAARYDHVVDLPAGSTVLLHTDGLVERRDASLDDGFAALAAAVTAVAAEHPSDLDALVDGVLARTLDAEAADDVAVLAVRLRPRG